MNDDTIERAHFEKYYKELNNLLKDNAAKNTFDKDKNIFLLACSYVYKATFSGHEKIDKELVLFAEKTLSVPFGIDSDKKFQIFHDYYNMPNNFYVMKNGKKRYFKFPRDYDKFVPMIKKSLEEALG